MSSKILLYGFNKSFLIKTDNVNQKSHLRGYHNHLKNIAANNSVVSLSSPQINDFWNIFIMLKKNLLVKNQWKSYHKAKQASYDSFINSKIEDYSEDTSSEWETCPTYPGLKMLFNRSNTIKVSYQCEGFKKHTEEFSGFSARIFQHQHSHLEAKDLLFGCDEIEIEDEKLREEHGPEIQRLFKEFKQKEVEKQSRTNSMEKILETRELALLRREITYCIIDHYKS